MRTSGITEFITPRQMATESSSMPKSVMKTIVGGYVLALWPATGNGRGAANHARQRAAVINVGLLTSLKMTPRGMAKLLLSRDGVVVNRVLPSTLLVASNIQS